MQGPNVEVSSNPAVIDGGDMGTIVRGTKGGTVQIGIPGDVVTYPGNNNFTGTVSFASVPVVTPESANTIFAGPISGSATPPTFRALVATDVPTLNQNTTGSAASAGYAVTAANVTGTIGAASILGPQLYNQFGGDQILVSNDASPFREGSWGLYSFGTLYTLLGDHAMKYWTHNAPISGSGDFLGRDEAGICTLWVFTEGGLVKTFNAVTAAAGVVPVWTLTSNTDTTTGQAQQNITGFANAYVLPAGVGGDANNITLTPTTPIYAYTEGQEFLFDAKLTNTTSTIGSGATATWTAAAGIVAATPTVAAGGSGYLVGDVVMIMSGNNNALLTVLTLAGSAVATWALTAGGTGYGASGTASATSGPNVNISALGLLVPIYMGSQAMPVGGMVVGSLYRIRVEGTGPYTARVAPYDTVSSDGDTINGGLFIKAAAPGGTNTLFTVTNTNAHSATAGAGIVGYSDSGSALANGDRMGFYLFGGATNAQHATVNGTGITGFATEAWSPTTTGSKLVFETTPNGTTTRIQAFTIDHNGGWIVPNTTVAPGTTGNQTINKMSGRVNIAAAGTTITVTNSLVDATSIVVAVVANADATALVKNVIPGAGSFIINLNAACTAETPISWMVVGS